MHPPYPSLPRHRCCHRRCRSRQSRSPRRRRTTASRTSGGTAAATSCRPCRGSSSCDSPPSNRWLAYDTQERTIEVIEVRGGGGRNFHAARPTGRLRRLPLLLQIRFRRKALAVPSPVVQLQHRYRRRLLFRLFFGDGAARARDAVDLRQLSIDPTSFFLRFLSSGYSSSHPSSSFQSTTASLPLTLLPMMQRGSSSFAK